MNRLEEVQTKLELVRVWLLTNGSEALLINSQANLPGCPAVARPTFTRETPPG